MKLPMFSLRLLFTCALLSAPFFANPASAQCVPPPTGMTNWWTGDGNAFDIIGDQHGSMQGAAAFEAGKVAQSFRLNGTDAYVMVPNNPNAAFNFAGSFSIDAWIYLKSAPVDKAPIVSKWNDLGVHQRSYFLALQPYSGALRLRLDVSADGLFLGGHSSTVFSADAIPLNTWTHVAGVFDATAHTLMVYVNGHASQSVAVISPNVSAPFVNNEPVLIGAGDLGSNARDFFHGEIDEVELFNRALTQAEIQALVNAGSAGKTIPIKLDIKPDGVPNSINLGSNGNVPVAILSTVTFDAATVNPTSVHLAGAPVKAKNNGKLMASLEDVNGDGRLDLVLHFATAAMLLNENSTEAKLTALTHNGRCISGTDSVNIVP